MPRRKKLPETSDIIGLGNPDKLTVQKSNPLQSLAKTNLTLPELKLLDVYLARIDSHDPEKRTVIIEKGELERVLCVTRILKDDLNKRLRNLFQIVEIEDATKPDGFKIISLFEEAEAFPDGNGLKMLLRASPSEKRHKKPLVQTGGDQTRGFSTAI